MRAVRVLVLPGLLMAAAATIGQASAASPAANLARCSVHAYVKDGQLSDTGALVGSVKCDHPFGNGTYYGRYRDAVTLSPVAGSETGSSKLSFKAGTVRGTYEIDRGAISGLARWHGTFHVTGGTGRFKHVSGTLNMTCAHRIPPLTDCEMSGPISGL